jgi:CRP-like cAMP-binding protein
MLYIKYKNIYSITILNGITPLSQPLNAFLSNKMTVSKFKKGDFIVKSGETFDRIHLVRKGLVRGYFAFKNTEVTTWVGVDSDLVASMSGYINKTPSLENVQCIEDTVTESLSADDFDYALKNYIEMNRLYRTIMERYYLFAEHRVFLSRIPRAIDRYHYFLKIYSNEVVKRLPKKYLASLLNIRPETLSRLDLEGF